MGFTRRFTRRFTRSDYAKVVFRCGLSNKSNQLLMFFTLYSNNKNEVKKSATDIMKLACIGSRNTFFRAVKELVDSGVISVKNNNSKVTGRRLSNTYKIIAKDTHINGFNW